MFLHYKKNQSPISGDCGLINIMEQFILIRGGGDIASGVALRLFRAGFKVVMVELEQPLSVRRSVSFSEAIFNGVTSIEGIRARRLYSINEIPTSLKNKEIPVLVDKNLSFIKNHESQYPVLIDARMDKKPPEVNYYKKIPLVIGIGPGFTAGYDCNIIIESSRGHFLGRAYRKGSALEDTGTPAGDPTRILRAPASGIITNHTKIGDLLESGQMIASIDNHSIHAPFTGLLRGLIHSGIKVKKGMKIGDMDHRTNLDLCHYASDKAMAIGGSVLEIILSDSTIRPVP